jgi:hypothetical protein
MISIEVTYLSAQLILYKTFHKIYDSAIGTLRVYKDISIVKEELNGS